MFIISRTPVFVSASLFAMLFMHNSLDAAFLDGSVIRANLVHSTVNPGMQTGPEAFATVGPGVEFSEFGFQETPVSLPALVDIDISDTTVRITLLIDQPFADSEVIHLSDFGNTIPNIIAHVDVDPSTNWNGFIPIRVSGFGEQISINLSQLSGLAGQHILLNVVEGIPEPAAFALVTTGIGAIMALRRDHHRSSVRRFQH